MKRHPVTGERLGLVRSMLFALVWGPDYRPTPAHLLASAAEPARDADSTDLAAMRASSLADPA